MRAGILPLLCYLGPGLSLCSCSLQRPDKKKTEGRREKGGITEADGTVKGTRSSKGKQELKKGRMRLKEPNVMKNWVAWKKKGLTRQGDKILRLAKL